MPLGPYPFDPNLISQGIPPDDRVTFNEQIYGPLEGTPMPPGPPAAGAAPRPAAPRRRPPYPPPRAAGALVRPECVHRAAAGPSVAIATYDPQTGQFATPDGTVGAADRCGRRATASDLDRPAADRLAGSASLTSLNGMVMNTARLRPQAPLGPVVASSPTRVFDVGSVVAPSGVMP